MTVAIAVFLSLLACEAEARCYPDGATQSCNKGTCQGMRTCNEYWSTCEYSGESTTSCTVCGRTGTRICNESGNLTNACSAHRTELCNGCDDDGDGLVDEDLSPTGSCDPKQNGCFGKYHCTGGGWQCIVPPTSYLYCGDMCGASARKQCAPDGTAGICMRDVAAPAEDCNGCDDDRDGVVDNLPGQGTGSLTRECTGQNGPCTGSIERCVNGRWSGVCEAPAESCNGLDDNCDGRIDENGVCRTDSLACTCTPTTCAAQGKTCGSLPNGCGGTLNCGSCGPGQSCTGNVCVSTCTPTTCAAQGKTCGTISNGCGGTLYCGTCGSNQSCTGNVCTGQ